MREGTCSQPDPAAREGSPFAHKHPHAADSGNKTAVRTDENVCGMGAKYNRWNYPNNYHHYHMCPHIPGVGKAINGGGRHRLRNGEKKRRGGEGGEGKAAAQATKAWLTLPWLLV